MEILDLKLDGNAIGGVLLEHVGSDMTALEMVCGNCGAHGEMARLDVYLGAGTVGRCSQCEAVMIRIVEGRGRAWIDLSGTASLVLR